MQEQDKPFFEALLKKSLKLKIDPFWTLNALGLIIENMKTPKGISLEGQILLDRFKQIADKLEKYCKEQLSSRNDYMASAAEEALSPISEAELLNLKITFEEFYNHLIILQDEGTELKQFHIKALIDLAAESREFKIRYGVTSTIDEIFKDLFADDIVKMKEIADRNRESNG